MNQLHVLTAVTRPENLPVIATSIANASTSEWQIAWHLSFDPEKQHVGGHALKNAMLDEIKDGWCWILDDDTLVHPDLLRRLSEVLTGKGDIWAVVVGQSGERGYLKADKDCVRVGQIDAGQAILRRDFIGSNRLPLTYEGDGHWLSALLPGKKDVVYLDEPLSLYNALERT